MVRGEAGRHALRVAARGPYAADAGLDPDAVRMIIYTSGTTARPKGVLHTHNSIHALICQIREHWQVDPGDRFLVPSPISHIGGSIYAFECPILLGTTAVLMERWDADDAVALMDRSAAPIWRARRRSSCRCSPPRARRHAPARAQGVHLRRRVGAAVADPRAASYFDRAVSAVSTARPRCRSRPWAPLATSTMPPRPTAARASRRQAAAHPAASPGEGEICAQGPQMLVGYLHPEDEAESFDAEGYFRTGDLGRWVDGDYLVVSGRAKDIIIRNGENIAPKEIEDILVGHPDIAEIAIVGLPDPRPANGRAP